MEQHDRDQSPELGLGPDPGAVGSLLAIRPGGVGDAVRSVPALRHLRETYPHARISVAVDAPGRELLDACPYVDRVIALEQPSEALLERFDVALSWAGPGETATPLGVDDVDARFRASWDGGGQGDRAAIRPSWPERLDGTTRMLRLAWLLGGSLEASTALGLWPSLADRNGAAQVVADAHRPLALVHAGARREARQWPLERWAAVVDLLDVAGLDPVLVGTVEDREATMALVHHVRHAPIDAVGRTSIGELAGLLERSVLFVGGDAGPAAMAGALGIRSVIVAPESRYEHLVRPGMVDLVDVGACGQCGEHACCHPAPPASHVPLEWVLARVELAAATAIERWRQSRIA